MSFDLAAYHAFIASKGAAAAPKGFAMRHDWSGLFPHQRAALQFACETGRSANFLDTGLGKSRTEAAFAQEALEASDRPTLILTPLSVARQMQRECAEIGVEARVIRNASEVNGLGVYIANYERLPKLDPSAFGGVVLDESSILKSFAGPTKDALCKAFDGVRHRLAATATPAPNDHMEIGNHAEFLGLMGSMEMLCRWFVNDTSTASQDWRLKGHATADFWSWVASWSRAASMPSDLGGDDTGYALPPLRYHKHVVMSDPKAGMGDAARNSGEQQSLFRMPDTGAGGLHKEKKITLAERVGRAAEIANQADGAVIVWCETNAESAALAKAIPDAVEVHGSMSIDQKEAALDAFSLGQRRVIVTKPKLAGFGLNWQHARTVIFASISHSYEQHYQAVRRSWRFGQTQPVECHVVISDTEAAVWANIRRKSADHDKMKAEMAKAMRGAQRSAVRRVAYSRAPEVALPSWLQETTNAA